MQRESVIDKLIENSLVNTDDQLEFVRSVLDKHMFSNQVHRQVNLRLAAIKHRTCDRSLYMAVVGEFNSGKSTFINALLADPLLKARVVATTAAETRITYGKELAIEVTSKNGKTLSLCESAGRCPMYSWLPQVADLSVREMIPIVTDESELANHVSRVTIGHHAHFLADGIVIIDTPGTNATYRSHCEITQRIVEEQADIAVILLPANQPVSQTLLGFLSGPLKAIAHRCVFILTKMDLVREREQQDIAEFARKRLCEALGRNNVNVLLSAPQIVLDIVDADTEVRSSDRRWGQSFVELQTALHQSLREQRDVVITEHLIRLMTDLFELLETQVKENWKSHQTKSALIEKETISDLEAFLAQIERKVDRDRVTCVRKVREAICTTVSTQRTSTTEEIRENVFATSSIEGLKAYLDDDLKNTLTSASDTVQNTLNIECGKLNTSLITLGSEIKKRFDQEYSKLSHLSANIASSAGTTSRGMSSNLPNINGAVEVATELKKGEDTAIGAGWAVGAAIGTILIPIPVIGTFIGVFLGGIIGRLFAPSMQEQQNKVWESLSPTVSKHFSQLESSTSTAIGQVDSHWKSTFADCLQQYGDRYEADVAKIKSEHEQALRRVRSLEVSAKRDIDEIIRRKQALQSTAERLSH